MVISTFSQLWPNAYLSVADFPLTPEAILDCLAPTPYEVHWPSLGVPGVVPSLGILRNCSTLHPFTATIGSIEAMDLQYLMEVLVTCPNLKEFHIATRTTGTNVQAAPLSSAVDFKIGGMLPPLEEVVLERYFLRFNSFCDVSQLRRVTVRDILMEDFLRSVRGRDLPRLEVFRTRRAMRSQGRRQVGTKTCTRRNESIPFGASQLA